MLVRPLVITAARCAKCQIACGLTEIIVVVVETVRGRVDLTAGAGRDGRPAERRARTSKCGTAGE